MSSITSLNWTQNVSLLYIMGSLLSFPCVLLVCRTMWRRCSESSFQSNAGTKALLAETFSCPAFTSATVGWGQQHWRPHHDVIEHDLILWADDWIIRFGLNWELLAEQSFSMWVSRGSWMVCAFGHFPAYGSFELLEVQIKLCSSFYWEGCFQLFNNHWGSFQATWRI